jgi:hypothetical protein
MKSMRDAIREREATLRGDETLYAAIAQLLEAGAGALRDRPQAGICRAGGCTKTTKADARYCRRHDVVSPA